MANSHSPDHPHPTSSQAPPSSDGPLGLVDRLLARRGILVGLIILGLLAALLSIALLSNLVGTQPATSMPTAALTPPPSLEDLAELYPELADLLNDPALGSVYKDFLIAYDTGGIDAAVELAALRGLLNDRDEIRITLVVDEEAAIEPISEELRSVGITIEGSYRDKVNVGIPLALIETLAEQQGVEGLFSQLSQMEHIIRLELPLPNRVDRLPSVQGEGVAITSADAWHDAGVTGQGIRVGVLDLGFDGYRDLLGTELPSQVVARSFVYGEEPDSSGEIHGTACAEIVHEMAPGAELLLAYYDGTIVSEGQAVDWLLQQGAQIISHSAGSILGPMDGTGEDAELVDEVAAKGVLWVNASGNEAEEHYRGVFTDSDGDGLHEFPDGQQELTIWPYSSQMTIVLNWDDWEDVKEDLDLILYDSAGKLVASVEDVQDGSPGQMAAEGLVISDVTDDLYFIAIKAYDTARAVVMDLYTLGAEVEFPVKEHSLSTPADARGSLSVGATEFIDDSLASYSSQGPTNDGRLKPEVSAPAGVSGASYGSRPFDGTSAATPHVAGAAALAWSAFPELNPQDVIAYLESNSRDLGPAGPDNGFGFGRLELPAVPSQAMPPSPPQVVVPTPSPIPTSELQPPQDLGPTPVSVAPPQAGSGPSSDLLLIGGLGVLGTCGIAATLGGAALLVVAWRRSRSLPGPEAPALPTAPEVTVGSDYGTLTMATGAPIHLREGRTIIGRDSDASQIGLDSPRVSRRHARIECYNGVCSVEDLDSSNGTFVNDHPVQHATLHPGDRLVLGGFELTYAHPEYGSTQAWLEISGVRFPLKPDGITIGRSDENDLHVDDGVVSRQHALVHARGGTFWIEDLNSSNGTYHNGVRIHEQELRDGDEIRIGSTSIRFHVGKDDRPIDS
jgi:pSer/pThr/pTyr-binding forkhead associated (FHA) protein/subtilisin family serine protease